ncbi:MAG: Rqc2 family fibronectin-binding protein [Fimbriimonas sp.]
MALRRIPFDSLCLAAIVLELQAYVGGRVQGIRQPNDLTVTLGLYASGTEAMLMMSAHPQFARCHFIQRRPPNQSTPPGLCAAMRARIEGGRLISATQRGFDRVLDLRFETPEGEHLLVGEFMGKHSNIILLDATDKILAAAKTVGRSKSSRPIISGYTYEPPPFEPRPSLLLAAPGDDLSLCDGASPFLVDWIEKVGPQRGLSAIKEFVPEPQIVPGVGAYPLDLGVFGLKSLPKDSLSLALEQHFDAEIVRSEVDQLRTSLEGQLKRVLDARDAALHDLQQAELAGRGAPKQQLQGELILAYGATLAPGAKTLEAWDYDGEPTTIRLDPELDFQENAQRYFEKARKAKGRLGFVRDQIERIGEDRAAILALLERVRAENYLPKLRDLYAEANGRRWLNRQLGTTSKGKDIRPFEGHRIREMLGPQGQTILYGENAEANDYLTQRVSKPNDIWLHVRGQTSAHVVIPTQGKPERISREVLLFAAKVAVDHSSMKHSGTVPVDWTLRKYVRKPRGAAKGTALYTHEKTLHIDGDR